MLVDYEAADRGVAARDRVVFRSSSNQCEIIASASTGARLRFFCKGLLPALDQWFFRLRIKSTISIVIALLGSTPHFARRV